MGPIPLTVKGTITKPELKVDMESIAKSAAKQVISGLTGKKDDAVTEDGSDATQSALSPEVAEKVQKADSVATAVQSAIENLPTKDEIVEQVKEQLPTKEEVVEGAKEQLKGAALDFLKGLGNKQ
jgi:ribonuclease HII